MPKRPCAVTISPDDMNIISGDKFGDVYSLPLLPTLEQDEAARSKLESPASATFAPTATEQTVHSKSNRRALEAQKKQAAEGSASKKKEPLAFAHEVLLGHVSLLTDVLVATIEDEEAETPKTYILTADRDEHIRVSRGPPQSFVIEGFCLGHGQFVNKLCLAEPTLLVSGGGDHELYIWHWLDYELVKRVSLLQAVSREVNNLKRKAATDDIEMGVERSPPNVVEEPEIVDLDVKIAVTGLWTCPGPTLGKVRRMLEDSDISNILTSIQSELLVTCEGIPAIFHLPVASLRDSKEHAIGFIPLAGNPLDITVVDGGIIVSVDTIHEPGSITIVDQGEVSPLIVHSVK
jgi:tRNA (guanine-N(7)-)-methyltransferase subunit TRM82